MQMRDERVLEVPFAECDIVKQQLPELMNGVAKLAAPVLVELGEEQDRDKAH